MRAAVEALRRASAELRSIGRVYVPENPYIREGYYTGAELGEIVHFIADMAEE
jgi:hypothetical protein